MVIRNAKKVYEELLLLSLPLLSRQGLTIVPLFSST
jgi:hypothetical protein